MLATDYWAPYEPDDRMPWNLRRVVHLHRRAGFAAAWNEIQRDLKDDPKASIDRLLAGKARGRPCHRTSSACRRCWPMPPSAPAIRRG
ncbi:MAG: hypothetical protein ACRELG_06395 [Gemmataceae bacterium]